MPGSVSDKGNENNNWQYWKNLCFQYGQNDPFMGMTLFQAWQSGQAWLPCTGDAASLWANSAPSYSPTGDCWSGSSVGNSSGSSKVTDDMSPEEKLAAREEEAQEDAEKQKLVDKFNNMYELLEKYGETLSETTSPKKSAFISILSKYKANVSTSTSTDVLNQKIDDLNALYVKHKKDAICKIAAKKGYENTTHNLTFYSKKDAKRYYYDEDTCSFKELFGVNAINTKGQCTYAFIKQKTFEEAKAISEQAAELKLRSTDCRGVYYSKDSKLHYYYDEKKKEFISLDKNIKQIYDNGRCAMQDGTMKTLNLNTMKVT